MNSFRSGIVKAQLVLLGLGLALLAGCGGGGSSTPVAAAPTISGTAATGAAIANATVHIKGANGVMVETTTDANGNYTSPNISTLTAPYLVHVIKAGPPAVELYSIGSAAGVVNIHPLTDLIIRTWYQVQGTDVVTEFNRTIPASPPTATELGVIQQVVKNLVTQFLALIGNTDSTSFDLTSTPFTANSTGFDRFLDNINVNAASGVIGINTSGVSGAGTLAEYQATLAVSGTAMTSTLAEDLNNDAAFSVVTTASNSITGITTSPYAGVWQMTGISTSLGTLCGGTDPIGTTYTLVPFVVDANGNFIFMDIDYPSFIGGKGNIAANGTFTFTSYGDSLVVAAGVSTGTCPIGTGGGTMSSVTAGTGTLTIGGQGLDLTLTRLSTALSQFNGIYTGATSHGIINATTSGIPDTLTFTVANGVITANVGTVLPLSGMVSASGAVTVIGSGSASSGTVTITGQIPLTSSGGATATGTWSISDAPGHIGTWTATRP